MSGVSSSSALYKGVTVGVGSCPVGLAVGAEVGLGPCPVPRVAKKGAPLSLAFEQPIKASASAKAAMIAAKPKNFFIFFLPKVNVVRLLPSR